MTVPAPSTPGPAIRERFLLRKTTLRRAAEPHCWQEMKRGRPCRIPHSKSRSVSLAHSNTATHGPTVCPSPPCRLLPPGSVASRQQNRYSCPQNPAAPCDETAPEQALRIPPRPTARSHCGCAGYRQMLPGTGVPPDAGPLAPEEPHRLPSGFRPQPPVPTSLSRSLLDSYHLYFGRDFLFDLEIGKDCTPALPYARCRSCFAPDPARVIVPRSKLPVA